MEIPHRPEYGFTAELPHAGRQDRRWGLTITMLAALLAWGGPACAELDVESTRLNGEGGTLIAAPGSTVNLSMRFLVTSSVNNTHAQVVLALDATPIRCLFDGVPADPPDYQGLDTTFDLPVVDDGVFTLYAVFDDQDNCGDAVNRYLQIGTTDPAHPRTPIGTIVLAHAEVKIQIPKHAFEPGESVEGQVIGVPRAASDVTVELQFFDESRPQDPGAIIASFNSGAGVDRGAGQPLSLPFGFAAPAQSGILQVFAVLKSGDNVLGAAYDRIGIRGPELKAAPSEVLAGQVVTLPVTDLLASLETSYFNGVPVEIQLGAHRRRVKVEEGRVFANPSLVPDELQDARSFIGYTTDESGAALPGSLVALTADPTTNRISGSIREITDPNAPVPSQGSLWVESMAQYDQTLDPHAGAHLVYLLSDTLPPDTGGHSHGEPELDRSANLLPGDINKDGAVDLSDAVKLIGALFLGDVLDPCFMAGAFPNDGGLAIMDWNGDGGQDLSDAIALLAYLFTGGPPHVLGSSCQPIMGTSCSSTCTPVAAARRANGEGAGGADTTVDIPVYIYQHPLMDTWRSLNVFWNWRALFISEMQNVPRRGNAQDKVSVSSVPMLGWTFLSGDGYFGLDCKQILKKFRDENQTSVDSLHILFTVHGLLSCGGRAYLATSTPYLHCMVVRGAITEAYESIVLAQETGHNLDYHLEDPFPHDAHLDPGISESWWSYDGWWIFKIWKKHCTAMMASYGDCDEPELRYYNSSAQPLNHLAEGIFQLFQ